MKSFLPHVLAIFAAAFPLAAADGINGKWQVHQSIAGNDSDLACTFTQTGEDLAGSCDGATGPVKIAGKVADKKVTWSFQSEYNGSPLTLTYTGTMESAAKISGTVNVDPFGVDGDFTATPAK